MEKESVKPRGGAKSATAFRTISEVSDELEVPQHVLRFWETKFPQVRPLKRGGGRRYYRPEDVTLLRKIQRLLYSEGYTIKGVQRLLKDSRLAGGEDEQATESGLNADFESDGEVETDSESESDLTPAEPEPAPPAPPPLAVPPPPPLSPPAAVSPTPPAQLSFIRHEPLLTDRVMPVAVISAKPEPDEEDDEEDIDEDVADNSAAQEVSELPGWLRRELETVRTELVELRVMLRRVLR
ncbi:MAG: MerR family transcriptional regulator [Rhodospirillaceae bacterium]